MKWSIGICAALAALALLYSGSGSRVDPTAVRVDPDKADPGAPPRPLEELPEGAYGDRAEHAAGASGSRALDGEDTSPDGARERELADLEARYASFDLDQLRGAKASLLEALEAETHAEYQRYFDNGWYEQTLRDPDQEWVPVGNAGKLASLRLPGDGTVQRVALTEDRSPFALALLRETRWVDKRMNAIVLAERDAASTAAAAQGR